MLGRIFGGKKEVAAASPQESISKLRETEDMLTKKQAHIEKLIQQVCLIIVDHIEDLFCGFSGN